MKKAKQFNAEEKIEELKANYKRFTGLELTDEDILTNAKIIRAEKATKFLKDNLPLYPQTLDVIAEIESRLAAPKAKKKVSKPKKSESNE